MSRAMTPREERAVAPREEHQNLATLPVNTGVQSMLSGKNFVRMLERACGSEDKARKLVLRVAHGAYLNPDWAQCVPHTIASAVLTVAAEGLELGSEVYLIPRNRKVGGNWVKELNAQTGVHGEVARVRKATGGKTGMRYAIIREGEDFELRMHEAVPVYHRIDPRARFENPELNAPWAAWACAVDDDGRWHNPVVMTQQEIESHRDKYVASKLLERPDNLWNKSPEAAWLKTVIRQAAKYVARGGRLADLDDVQTSHAERMREELAPPPRPQHGPEAAEELVARVEETYAPEQARLQENNG